MTIYGVIANHLAIVLYTNTNMLKQYQPVVTESAAPGFNVYQARVKVKNPLYNNSMDVAIFAKNPQMARMLLKAQYGNDSLVTNVVKIA